MPKPLTPYTVVVHTPTIFTKANYSQTKKWLNLVLDGEPLDKVGLNDGMTAPAVKSRVLVLLKTIHKVIEEYPRVLRYLEQKFPGFKRWDLLTKGSVKHLRGMRDEILYCVELLETKGVERKIHSMAYYINANR